MKKLVLILFIIPLFAFAQTVVGDFKIDNGEIIWQKIYEDSLKIESQDLSLKAVGLPYMSTTFWLQDLEGGKLIVNHKNGRTRLTIKDIYSISSTALNYGGVMTNPDKPSYAHEMYVKRKKGVFKKLFLKKDGNLLNQIIIKEINSLINENSTDEDW